MTKIEINDLKFTYPGDNFGLKIKHLTFSEGMIAIIGQNGAGKSTLLRLLSGLNQPDSGEITVEGQNLNDYIGDKRLERIGLTFQDPNDQIFNATVKKEVEWGLRQMDKPETEVERITEEVLQEVGLADKMDENPYDLSLSERKLLSIATVVAVRPKILLFDEPMMSLDWPSRKKITAIFRYLAEDMSSLRLRMTWTGFWKNMKTFMQWLTENWFIQARRQNFSNRRVWLKKSVSCCRKQSRSSAN